MKTTISLASLCLSFFASAAFAADVSVKGRLDETVDASNNYFLSNSPSGHTIKLLNSLNLNALAATPTTRYSLDTNASYYNYYGPGAADTPVTWGIPLDAKFNVDHTDKLSKYNFVTSWQRADVATTALAQTGTFIGRGTINTYNVGGGVTRDLNRLDSISLSTRETTASYSDPNQTPYRDYAITGAWNHRLTATTTLTQSLNVDWFIAENFANSQRLFWNPMTGLQTQLSSRLSFNGSVGMAFVNAWQNGTVQSTVPTANTLFQPTAGTSNGWTGNTALNYKLLKTTHVSFTATHSITPTVFGQLQKIDSVGLTLNHDISRSANLALLTQFSHLTIAATAATPAATSDFFTASARYGYKLTRDWRSSLAYTYRQGNSQTGLVRASTISFVLTRDFTVYGKPPPEVKKTSTEEAQEVLQRAEQALPTLAPY